MFFFYSRAKASLSRKTVQMPTRKELQKLLVELRVLLTLPRLPILSTEVGPWRQFYEKSHLPLQKPPASCGPSPGFSLSEKRCLEKRSELKKDTQCPTFPRDRSSHLWWTLSSRRAGNLFITLRDSLCFCETGDSFWSWELEQIFSSLVLPSIMDAAEGVRSVAMDNQHLESVSGSYNSLSGSTFSGRNPSGIHTSCKQRS